MNASPQDAEATASTTTNGGDDDSKPYVYGSKARDQFFIDLVKDHYEPGEGVLTVNTSDIRSITNQVPEKDPDKILANSADQVAYDLTLAAREMGYDDISIVAEEADTRIEDVRADHIGGLVSIDVRITDRTDVKPRTMVAAWRCLKSDCGNVTTVRQSRRPGELEEPTGKCPRCERQTKWEHYEHSGDEILRDVQEMLAQDLHTRASTPNPEDIRIVSFNHLVNQVEPGETVTLTGIVKDKLNGKKVSEKYIQAVGIKPHDEDYRGVELTDEDVERIKEIAEDENAERRLAESIAPSIAGDYSLARRALLYQLVGGVDHSTDSEQYRETIHVAFVGDPGTAKSSLGKYTAEIAPTGVYASADGASQVGITAAVEYEDRFDSAEYKISGGALVRADGGHCVIDELDKGNESVKKALQEPLSEQQVSVSKVISATLPARCSALLIANPENERFNFRYSIAEQIDINPAVWDRMDAIVPFRDEPDEDFDADVANAILDRAAGEEIDHIGPDMLRKYIAYAREYVTPTMTDEAREFLRDEYVSLRSQSSGSRVATSARTIDSLVRLAEASARVRLSDEVTVEDAERAVEMTTRWMSLLATDSHGEWDIDAIRGKSAEERDVKAAMWASYEAVEDEEGAQRDDVVDLMTQEDHIDKQDAQQAINAATGRGDLSYDSDTGYLQREGGR